MRTLVVALMIGLVLAPAAQAKLNPSFNERVAMPGDTIELDLGRGIEQFHGPLRIFLVSLEGTERRQFKIAELGTPGGFGTPRVLRRALRVEVPALPVGDYTAAIWFGGYATGTWENVFEGIRPLLTIASADERAASPASSDGESMRPRWIAALAACGLVAGHGTCGWRRVTCRAATGVSPS